MTLTSLFIVAGLLTGPTAPLPRNQAAAPPKIVTSLTTYGAIAREIVGDKGTVTSIAQGDEDPHFVQPKPSFVAILRERRHIRDHGNGPRALGSGPAGPCRQPEGRRMAAPGYVDGISRNRSARGAYLAQPSPGRHPRGRQPTHPHRSAQRDHHRPEHPRRACKRVSPENAAYFAGREQDFEKRVLEATMGQELVGILTPATAYSICWKRQAARLPRHAEVPGQAAR